MSLYKEDNIKRLIRAQNNVVKCSALMGLLIDGNYHAYEIDQIADQAVRAANMAEVEIKLVIEHLRNKAA